MSTSSVFGSWSRRCRAWQTRALLGKTLPQIFLPSLGLTPVWRSVPRRCLLCADVLQPTQEYFQPCQAWAQARPLRLGGLFATLGRWTPRLARRRAPAVAPDSLESRRPLIPLSPADILQIGDPSHVEHSRPNHGRQAQVEWIGARVAFPLQIAHGDVMPDHVERGLENPFVVVLELALRPLPALGDVLGDLGPDLADAPLYDGPFNGRYRTTPARPVSRPHGLRGSKSPPPARLFAFNGRRPFCMMPP